MAATRLVLLCAVVMAVPISLWWTYRIVGGYYKHVFPVREQPVADPPPNLSASAGDGDVRLTWTTSSDKLLLIEQWEFQQSVSGSEATEETHSTGSKETAYLVSGLTNGTTYHYRVRSVLKGRKFGGWSNTVSVTPIREGDVLERLERDVRTVERRQWWMARQQEQLVLHQDAIVQQQMSITESSSAIADVMAKNGEVVRELAGRGIGALETLAASSEETSEELADVREEIGTVAEHVGEIGGSVTKGLSRIDTVAGELRARLSRIEGRLNGPQEEPEEMSDDCGDRGTAESVELTFDNNSANVGNGKNWDKIRNFADGLNRLSGGLVLTIGYATAIGEDAYNLHLSDLRAACVSHCVRERLGAPGSFEFREVARGEAVVPEDLPGTSPRSRRVDLILCQGVDNGGQMDAGEVPDVMRGVACGCEPTSSEVADGEEGA